MIEVSRSLPANDGMGPVLSVDDVWDGLVEKASNPLPYVRSITECRVTERFEHGLVRDIIHAGQPVREVVTFYPKRRVHFVRTHGTARGTIDNEISRDEAGTLVLTFTFRIEVDGVQPGSAEERQFAARMEDDYLDAVRTTLAAMRERVARASAGSSPEDFAGKVFGIVDSSDAAGFAALFAAGGSIRFGNADPLVGPGAIRDGVTGFFATIAGLSHRVLRHWDSADGRTAIELDVSYERLDGKTVTIPVAVTWHRDRDGLFDDYRVYYDITPVYAS
jgi:hypothetical protein